MRSHEIRIAMAVAVTIGLLVFIPTHDSSKRIRNSVIAVALVLVKLAWDFASRLRRFRERDGARCFHFQGASPKAF